MALCDGTVARAAADRPGPQAHRRGRHRAEHRRHGRLRARRPTGYDADALTATFVQPVVDHLAAAGTPYVGVLYAGLMLTADGPRLLEFNCRFGDPETQAVLPLLDSPISPSWRWPAATAACAESSLTIRDGRGMHGGRRRARLPGSARRRPGRSPVSTTTPADALVFPAGTDGAHRHRRPGARRHRPRRHARRRPRQRLPPHVERSTSTACRSAATSAGAPPAPMLTSYAAAGVDIDEGTRAVSQMKQAVERTHGPAVLRGVGSFGGAFSGKAIKAMDEPVLVASTDGVGTKVELAARLGRYRGVGADIVNHCIDDVLVQGARPLFFLDYIASSKLDADHVAEVVTGMAEACEAAGCALLGGETAEMPGVYAPGAFDIAGTLVGVVEQRDLLPRGELRAGDVLIGLASNGPHTNGYSLLAQAVRLAADGLDAARLRPPARRDAAGAAPQLPRRARRVARRRAGEGAGPHHRRRPAREPAPRAARRVRRRHPARLVAGAAACSTWCARSPRSSTPTSCTAR